MIFTVVFIYNWLSTDIASSASPAGIKFGEIYTGGGARGLKFSPKIKGLEKKTVSMIGYMAPPLKPTLDFFVLSKVPMAICPFCSTDADWPSDIVLVITRTKLKALPNDLAIKVTGRLELGSYTDPVSGFVSQVRIYADKIEPAD